MLHDWRVSNKGREVEWSNSKIHTRTERMRSDFSVMRDIATYTRVFPAQRARELLSFVRDVNNCIEVNEDLKDWGITLNPEMLAVQGRIFPAETIHFAHGKGKQTGSYISIYIYVYGRHFVADTTS